MYSNNPSTSLLDRVVDNLIVKLQDLGTDLADTVLMRNKGTMYTDLNKVDSYVKIKLYNVTSNQLEPKEVKKVNDILEKYYVAVVENIIKALRNTVDSNKEAQKLINQKLGNNSVVVGKSSATDMIDNVSSTTMITTESIELTKDIFKNILDENLVFNEAKVKVRVNRQSKNNSNGSNNNANTSNKGQSTKDAIKKELVKFGIGLAKDAIKGLLTPKESKDIELVYTSSVDSIMVDSPKLIDLLATTPERDLLYNYFKSVATTKGSLFKDFILNLDQIKNEVDRKFSDNISDRILSDMVRTGSFLVPSLISDLRETKHFILTISSNEVDIIKSKYNIDLRSPTALTMLFNKYNILSFVIYNQDTGSMTIYSSNNPLSGVIVDVNKSNGEVDKLFSVLLKR